MTNEVILPAGSASAFYVTTSDALRLASFASVTCTLEATALLLDTDGIARPITISHTPNTDRTIGSAQTQLYEGWIYNITIRASSGAPIIGQAWARIDVVRGGGSGAFVLGALASGYVTAQQPIAWPGGVMRSTLDGRGALRSITGTNPAAGAEISETVPTGAVWRLVTFGVNLTTDATAANRVPTLVIDDGAITIYTVPAPRVQTASLTRRHLWAEGVPYAAGINSLDTPGGLPVNMYLSAGFRIQTLTANVVAGDDYGAPQMLVEEWLRGA